MSKGKNTFVRIVEGVSNNEHTNMNNENNIPINNINTGGTSITYLSYLLNIFISFIYTLWQWIIWLFDRIIDLGDYTKQIVIFIIAFLIIRRYILRPLWLRYKKKSKQKKINKLKPHQQYYSSDSDDDD